MSFSIMMYLIVQMSISRASPLKEAASLELRLARGAPEPSASGPGPGPPLRGATARAARGRGDVRGWWSKPTVWYARSNIMLYGMVW